MLPAKKLKPLTARQVDVLTKLAFGEIFAAPVYPGKRHTHLSRYVKWNDCGVDASSVVRILYKRKLIRYRPLPDSENKYATPTPAGFAELEKHPAPWND